MFVDTLVVRINLDDGDIGKLRDGNKILVVLPGYSEMVLEIRELKIQE